MMQVVLKKQYNGIEITVTGNENEDVAQKLADTLIKVGVVAPQDILGPAAPVVLGSAQGSDSNLTDLVQLDKQGPLLTAGLVNKLSSGTQQDIQSKAFAILAYLLKTKYGKADLTSNAVTALMKASGVSNKNIHNTTGYLAKALFITKTKGGKAFKLTTKGEEFARSELQKAQS